MPAPPGRWQVHRATPIVGHREISIQILGPSRPWSVLPCFVVLQFVEKKYSAASADGFCLILDEVMRRKKQAAKREWHQSILARRRIFRASPVSGTEAS